MSTDQTVATVAARLREASHVVVLTGAGISVESGIPTFRGAQTGLWAKYRSEDLATPEAFARDPVMVWQWYLWRRALCLAAAPNAGHLALVEMERHAPRFTLVTQNVDGLHRRAGSKQLLELHGCLLQARRLDDEAVLALPDVPKKVPPRCPRTGVMLRPNVVWFGESLPRETLAEARQASQDCDLMLAVGTSSLVYPAAGLPLAALALDVFVVEVNPQRTPLSAMVSARLGGGAATVLPRLVAEAWAGQP